MTKHSARGCELWRATILAAVLAAAAPTASAQSLPDRLAPGKAYLYRQEVTASPGGPGVHSPRFDLVFESQAGLIAVSAGDGPARDVPKVPEGRRLITASYFLPGGGCAVDFIAGEALLQGEACKTPLVQSWSYKVRGETVACEVVSPQPEDLQVPAGRFDTLRIRCRRPFANPPAEQTTTYWYAPALRVMVLTERRTITPQGKDVFSTRETLLEISDTPRP